jgi:hypothetical protein
LVSPFFLRRHMFRNRSHRVQHTPRPFIPPQHQQISSITIGLVKIKLRAHYQIGTADGFQSILAKDYTSTIILTRPTFLFTLSAKTEQSCINMHLAGTLLGQVKLDFTGLSLTTIRCQSIAVQTTPPMRLSKDGTKSE